MQLKAFPGGWEEHANKHCIWIVSPPGYSASHAFDEVAETLSAAFSELGGSAPVVHDTKDFRGRVPIIYGANLLAAMPQTTLPEGSIIVNLEQVSTDSEWFNAAYLSHLKTCPVIDYSPRNRENLVSMGVNHAELLEIGYHPCLRRIRPAREKDIDVLFYGSRGERRNHVLQQIHERGLKLAVVYGVFGAERDAAIARSKIVLNVHHYSAAVFEIVRASYLMANATCVLTEGDPDDPDILPYREGLAIEPYERLADRAVELIANDKERAILAARGWDAMRRRPLAPMLKALMEKQ
ncbi:glycosyltransferase [Rhizobium sp. L1K21]|uniref:glycosyltransferase family protein n=1 Tax=Rhizobium sp. L1K21 TaxID=2954933 RepID=UPI0020936171|nr:glycosyltransferase [Rhizobium sp. L1K21]MCO6187503.1 glycosyltransferase [Rhizobium sp. L1K21]